MHLDPADVPLFIAILGNGDCEKTALHVGVDLFWVRRRGQLDKPLEGAVASLRQAIALLVLLAAMIVPGFEVAGFWSALLFGILLSLINALFSALD